MNAGEAALFKIIIITQNVSTKNEISWFAIACRFIPWRYIYIGQYDIWMNTYNLVLQQAGRKRNGNWKVEAEDTGHATSMHVLVHEHIRKSRQIAIHATSYVLPAMRKRAFVKTLRLRNKNISTVKDCVNFFPSGDLKLDDDVPSVHTFQPLFLNCHIVFIIGKL